MNFNTITFDFPLESRTGILNHFKRNEDHEAKVEIITDHKPFLGMIANLSAHSVHYQVGNYKGSLARHYFNFFSLRQQSCRWLLPRGTSELMLVECPEFLLDLKASTPVLDNFLENRGHQIVMNPEHLAMNVEVLDDVMALLRERPAKESRDTMLELRCKKVVLSALMHSTTSPEREAAELEATEIRRVYDYMINNLASVADTRILFDISSLPKERLREKFIAMYGQTLPEALKAARIRKAEDLLLHSTLPINEIALQVGYSSSPHFLHAFLQQHGVYPGEFRKNFTDRNLS